MPKNNFITLPELGYVLVDGPLYEWLTEQNSNVVALPWISPQKRASTIGTAPFQYLRWRMVLHFDENKRAKQVWRLEPDGQLPNEEVMAYIEETFS